jgi:hypothetical protein
MIGLWTRLRFASARDLGLAALFALGAAVMLDKVGPRGRYDDFFVGVLFGLGLGMGVFALGAYARSRTHG